MPDLKTDYTPEQLDILHKLELIEMVDKIGVQRKWIQHPGTPNEHFDICFSKRQKAIKHGAIEIGMREYAERVQKLAAINNIHWARTSIDKIKIGVDFGQGRDVTVISEIRSGAIRLHSAVNVAYRLS